MTRNCIVCLTVFVVATTKRTRCNVCWAAYMRLYYASHPAYVARVKEANARRKKVHPDKIRMWARAYSSGRRAQRRGNRCDHLECRRGGAVAVAMTNLPLCYICGADLDQHARRGQRGYMHLDHVVPLARGGLHCAYNLRPACAACNEKKGAKMPDALRRAA